MAYVGGWGKYIFQDTSNAETAMITINRVRETEKKTSPRYKMKLATYLPSR